MNIGQLTDRNLNVRQLKNRVIPLMPPQVTSLLRNLDSNTPKQVNFDWNSPHRNLRNQNLNSAEKL